MTREEQKEKRRMQIIDVALDLFTRKGYAATKTGEISKAVGMSEGLLFHYFPTKENLLEELVKIGIMGMQSPWQQEFSEPIAFFENFTELLLSYMREQPYIAKIFTLMAQVQRNEGIPEHIRQMALSVDTAEYSEMIIKAGQSGGNIRRGDPKALVNAYWCSIQGIAEQFAVHPELPLPEAEWIVDIIREKNTAGGGIKKEKVL